MKNKIVICMGSSCYARGNKKNLQTIEAFLKANGLEAEIDLAGSCCKGKCAEGPVLEINGKLLKAGDPEALADLLEDIFSKKE